MEVNTSTELLDWHQQRSQKWARRNRRLMAAAYWFIGFLMLYTILSFIAWQSISQSNPPQWQLDLMQAEPYFSGVLLYAYLLGVAYLTYSRISFCTPPQDMAGPYDKRGILDIFHLHRVKVATRMVLLLVLPFYTLTSLISLPVNFLSAAEHFSLPFAAFSSFSQIVNLMFLLIFLTLALVGSHLWFVRLGIWFQLGGFLLLKWLYAQIDHWGFWLVIWLPIDFRKENTGILHFIQREFATSLVKLAVIILMVRLLIHFLNQFSRISQGSEDDTVSVAR